MIPRWSVCAIRYYSRVMPWEEDISEYRAEFSVLFDTYMRLTPTRREDFTRRYCRGKNIFLDTAMSFLCYSIFVTNCACVWHAVKILLEGIAVGRRYFLIPRWLSFAIQYLKRVRLKPRRHKILLESIAVGRRYVLIQRWVFCAIRYLWRIACAWRRSTVKIFLESITVGSETIFLNTTMI